MSVLTLIALAMMAGSAFAQITVSKDPEDLAMFSTIQAAINRAEPGQTITILDTATYVEQVTIEGRTAHPWGAGIIGGKTNITLRYVAPPGSPANHRRPTIRHRDTVNVSPRNSTEARAQDQGPGQQHAIGTAGNFETNGALRIIRTTGVTIEGIRVDGVSAFEIANDGVWCGATGGQCWPLIHGNAAIAVAVSGSIQIRDCELVNSYFGIAVKDRNTGGVYANPNDADNDQAIPLAGFGRSGNHLFEYNRVGGNVVGVYFESSWDRGSTIRYNLIYQNFWRKARPALGSGMDWAGGGIRFKDNYLSPVAIYNNTFFENERNLNAGWKVGVQHLVFNNIFGRNRASLTNTDQFASISDPQLSIDPLFRNRMFNSVFSANQDIQVQGQSQSQQNCTPDPIFRVAWVDAATFQNQMPAAERTARTLTFPYSCNYGQGPQPGTQTQLVNGPLPGALMFAGAGAGAAAGFPQSAGIRWLETAGITRTSNQTYNNSTERISITLPNLFRSIDPTSADFLVPRYDDADTSVMRIVHQFIKNAGWTGGAADGPTGVILNDDGSIADIGAIPYSGKRPTDGRAQLSRARISPFSVVTVQSGAATRNRVVANIMVTEEMAASIDNLSIKYIRWVSPIPFIDDTSAPIPLAAGQTVEVVGNPTLSVGSNRVTLLLQNPIPPASLTPSAATDNYGFFEIVLHGTANGRPVNTDVGFMPYRDLRHFFDIEIRPLTGETVLSGPNGAGVRAGETVRMIVTPRSSDPITVPIVTEYNLLPDELGAFIYCQGACPAGVSVGGVLTGGTVTAGTPVTYQVQFHKADRGMQVITAAGLAGRMVFNGDVELLVRPGTPDSVLFIRPPSVKQGLPPSIINRGMPDSVIVEVQDRFGNAVWGPVAAGSTTVTIASSDPDIIDAGAPGVGGMAIKTATADTATGRVLFMANVTRGSQNEEVTLTGTLNLTGNTDQGRLRIGRTLDRLMVFYADTGSGTNWTDYHDPSEVIDGIAGQWYQVTVKATAMDSVITSKGGFVLITPDRNGIIMSATQGGVPDSVFQMTGGVSRFWISTAPGWQDNINNACVLVTQVSTNNPLDTDYSIQPNERCDISFEVLTSDIEYAVVYGDGNGRPTTVHVRFDLAFGASLTDPGVMPDSVLLMWPVLGSASRAVAPASRISVLPDGVTIAVDFSGLTSDFPAGRTSIIGNGMGLVGLHMGASLDVGFPVLDGIGPLVADTDDGVNGMISPMLRENLNPATIPDTLFIQLTEDLKGFDHSVLGNPNAVYFIRSATRPGPAEVGTPLVVETVFPNLTADFGYRLIIPIGSPAPGEGDWIRLGSAAGIEDRAGSGPGAAFQHTDNGVHAENRWVQVGLLPTRPDVMESWFTSSIRTGYVDTVFVRYNKNINPATWFSGGFFRFGAGADSIAMASAPAGLLSLDPADSMMLRINMGANFTGNPSWKTGIRTGVEGGVMNLTVGYAPAFDWFNAPVRVEDRAKPVLADTVYLLIGAAGLDGVGSAPDTLVVTYSEPLAPEALANTTPVILQRGIGNTVLTLRNPVASSVRGTFFQEVRYLVDMEIEPAAVTGDLVYINPNGGIYDAITPPNVQDSTDNLRQPLVVRSGPLAWEVRVLNNPFRGGNAATVTIRPESKGCKVDVKAKILLFNNMGNVIIDTTLDNSAIDGNTIRWSWDGHNRKGRMVGTGTYLMRATVTATQDKECDDDARPERRTIQRSIGFVRGKN